MYIVFFEDLMSFDDPMSTEVRISYNNMLSKTERKKKKEKELCGFLWNQQYRYPQNRICNNILILLFRWNKLLANDIFGFVWFYGISNIVGYSMPNPLYIYIYIRCMICEHILYITYLNETELIFLHTVKWFQAFLSNMNNSIYD